MQSVDAELDQRGRTTLAHIVGIRPKGLFEYEGSQEGVRVSGTCRGIYQIGQTVSVRYLPEDSSLSKVSGDSNSGNAYAMIAIGATFMLGVISTYFRGQNRKEESFAEPSDR